MCEGAHSKPAHAGHARTTMCSTPERDGAGKAVSVFTPRNAVRPPPANDREPTAAALARTNSLRECGSSRPTSKLTLASLWTGCVRTRGPTTAAKSHRPWRCQHLFSSAALRGWEAGGIRKRSGRCAARMSSFGCRFDPGGHGRRRKAARRRRMYSAWRLRAVSSAGRAPALQLGATVGQGSSPLL
jgi:hypothetical protein